MERAFDRDQTARTRLELARLPRGLFRRHGYFDDEQAQTTQ
jgi:hypothetical protein